MKNNRINLRNIRTVRCLREAVEATLPVFTCRQDCIHGLSFLRCSLLPTPQNNPVDLEKSLLYTLTPITHTSLRQAQGRLTCSFWPFHCSNLGKVMSRILPHGLKTNPFGYGSSRSTPDGEAFQSLSVESTFNDAELTASIK